MLANDQSQPQSFWVIVPTYNPGKDEWAQWLRALKAQVCQPQKVIVVDSGSVDGTQTLTQAEGHSCLEINAKDFDHGGTRQWALNKAVEAAAKTQENSPEYVVFLTQDAILSEPSALKNLIQAFDNPSVSAAYGRQLPKPDANWLEAFTRHFNYPEQSQTVSLADREKLGLKACFFSNAFGAYRTQALLAQGGFSIGLPLGEDTLMAAKLLLSGQSLQYQAQAAVYHSHHYNVLQDFQRMFDTGVFHAQNNWLLQSFGKPEGEGIRLLKSQWAFLKASAHSPSKLFGLLQMVHNNAVKFCGYKIGTCYRFLPLSLKLRFAMNKSFWHQRK
jgi:rhamnosyltransferase